MALMGVRVEVPTNQPIVLLREEGGSRYLPIFIGPPEATAIVYTNSTSTSPLTKNIPSMRYLSYRLTLHRDGPEWLVTGMTAVTNLDLTPKI